MYRCKGQPFSVIRYKKLPHLGRNIWKLYEFPWNRELNWRFLSIFSKTNFLNFFNTLKEQDFFYFIYSFEEVRLFWAELYIFLSKFHSATNQQLLYVTESDIGQRPSNHAPLLCELLVLVLRFTLSFDEMSRPAEELDKTLVLLFFKIKKREKKRRNYFPSFNWQSK